VGVISGNPRAGILSLLVLFVVGGWVLVKVEVLQ
jgi:MFS-type transporter involved in bile tolerance (Atg22 family)